MTEAIYLKDLFQINSRFCRSVNIQADYAANHLSGYIVTPLCRSVLRRLGQGLQAGSRERAWSITGPYGAGKSACALFAARVLSYPKDEQAHELLRAADADLYEELSARLPGLVNGAFLIVPAVGSREPLALVLLRALSKALSHAPHQRPALRECIAQLHALCEQLERGQLVFPALALEAIEQAAAAVHDSPGSPGLLIILDELGKVLEHAALNPGQEDVFLLQELAEHAARSEKHAIGLVVILHQAFERYAARLSPQQQREWAKVQGRFQDMPFLASTEELLHLVGAAIEPSPRIDGLAAVIAAETMRAQDLQLAPRDIAKEHAAQILARCAPLHPTVSLVLGRLFRSHLAQNERSLFAFLSSSEPMGFQSYLQRTRWSSKGKRPFYRLPDLYDYILATMGSVLYAQLQGKRWAEIDEAVNRLPPQCTSLQVQLVKTIGMLGLLGDQVHLKASAAVLSYALADGKEVKAEEVQAELQQLCQWGIAIFRRHRGAYSLWEGSDVDLEERFRQGLRQIDHSVSLAQLLEKQGALQPYLAKRHLHRTGTLRYFAPRITTLENLVETAQSPLEGPTALSSLCWTVRTRRPSRRPRRWRRPPATSKRRVERCCSSPSHGIPPACARRWRRC